MDTVSYVKHINNIANYYANNSPILSGIAMIILNIGTKYVYLDISEKQDEFIKTILFRRIAVFTIFWIGTKDIYSSIALTVLYIIFIVHIFNENSKYYLLKKRIKNLT